MKHVFLVTSKYKFRGRGDSLTIEGVFKEKKLAKEYVASRIDGEAFDYTITKMNFGAGYMSNYPHAFYEDNRYGN